MPGRVGGLRDRDAGALGEQPPCFRVAAEPVAVATHELIVVGPPWLAITKSGTAEELAHAVVADVLATPDPVDRVRSEQ